MGEGVGRETTSIRQMKRLDERIMDIRTLHDHFPEESILTAGQID